VEPVKWAICRSEKPRPFALANNSEFSGGIGGNSKPENLARVQPGVNPLAAGAGLRYEKRR
jgi:hypothetical protein